MPQVDLMSRLLGSKQADKTKKLRYEKYGVIENPFPSSAQTSGHPRNSDDADSKIDDEIVEFYNDINRDSHVIAITASQGVGKTNILNEYERKLGENVESLGFFIIRYIPDPEASFDPLLRTIFDALGEKHLRDLAKILAKETDEDVKNLLKHLRSRDMERMLFSIRGVAKDYSKFDEYIKDAQEWLLGLPVRKNHRDNLKIHFRLDTVESKTQALRDLVTASYLSKSLQGIFLLLDELEKQGSLLPPRMLLRYLSALRALIDALPKNLFLMIALTPDALSRYREILPALRGRLMNKVELKPLMNLEDALKLYEFYLGNARDLSKKETLGKGWNQGNYPIVLKEKAEKIFQNLRKKPIEGVRQREFLDELHQEAQNMINVITQQKSNL